MKAGLRSLDTLLLCGVVLIGYSSAALLFSLRAQSSVSALTACCGLLLCDDYRLIVAGFDLRAKETTEDVSQATRIFRDLVLRNSASPDRWCELGDVLFQGGRVQGAQYCFERGCTLAPHSPSVLLNAGDFYFNANDLRRALDYMRRVLQESAHYDEKVFGYYNSDRLQIQDILAFGLPRTKRAYSSYLRYLISQNRAAVGDAVWNDMGERGLLDDSTASEYVNFLIGRGLHSRAVDLWNVYAGPRTGDRTATYIFNGGFEYDFSPSLFDWKVRPVAGVRVIRDATISHSGRFSLRAEFETAENVVYEHISQEVVLPRGAWRLTAYVRSKDIAGDDGIRFRVFDPVAPASLNIESATVAGPSGWQELTKEFRVDKDSQLLEVSVTRHPSARFYNQLHGTIWLDDVRLSRLSP